jgi:hypothetical protein
MNLPPRINLTPTLVSYTSRYVANETVNNILIYPTGIAAGLGGVATSTTTLQLVCSSFRLKSVRLWPAEQTAGSEIRASLSWTAAGSIARDENLDRTFPAGITVTGTDSLVPVSGSYQSFWAVPGSDSNSWFETSAPQGSILDVTIEATLPGALTPPAALAVTGLTLGNYYYPSLDTTSFWVSLNSASIPYLGLPPPPRSEDDDDQDCVLICSPAPLGRPALQSRGVKPTSSILSTSRSNVK